MATKGTVLLIGGSGYLGKLVGMYLTEHGYAINSVGLEPRADFVCLGYPCQYFQWDGESFLPDAALQGTNGPICTIINLAGDPLTSERWGKKKRKAILESRVRSVEVAVDAAARCRAATLIQGSSIDYYGDPKGQEVTESSGVGEGFWPETIARWESATSTLNHETRLVILRMGEVYTQFGGTFRARQMAYGFRMGAPDADPNRYFGWIHGKDLGRLVKKAIETIDWQGPINATAPEPASYDELHQQFSRFFPGFMRIAVPYWLKRLAFGQEMRRTTFNRKAIPAKALEAGFQFKFPNLAACMTDLADHTAPYSFFYTTNQWVPASPQQVWAFLNDASKWAKLSPHLFRMEYKDIDHQVIAEGVEYEFTHYFLGVLPSQWRMKMVNLREPHKMHSITQQGTVDMLDMVQELTAVAGGTRIDMLMRYEPLVHGLIFGPLVYRLTYNMNKYIFDYRQKVINDALTEPTAREKKLAG